MTFIIIIFSRNMITTMLICYSLIQIHEIHLFDVYEDLNKDKDLFDNRVYPPDWKFTLMTTKKVIGKMKDETAVVPITHFRGLKSKINSYKMENDNNYSCNEM